MTTLTVNDEKVLQKIYNDIDNGEYDGTLPILLPSLLNAVKVADTDLLIKKYGETANVFLNLCAGIKLKPRTVYELIKRDALYNMIVELNISPAYFGYAMICDLFNTCDWGYHTEVYLINNAMSDVKCSEPFSDASQNTYNFYMRKILEKLKVFYE